MSYIELLIGKLVEAKNTTLRNHHLLWLNPTANVALRLPGQTARSGVKPTMELLGILGFRDIQDKSIAPANNLTSSRSSSYNSKGPGPSM